VHIRFELRPIRNFHVLPPDKQRPQSNKLGRIDWRWNVPSKSLYVSSPVSRLFRLSVGKERNECTDSDSRSIGHLSRQWVAENQLWMRVQPVLLQTKNKITTPLEQLSDKAAKNRPAQSHDPACNAGEYYGDQ
jgi:hypothetical protein